MRARWALVLLALLLDVPGCKKESVRPRSAEAVVWFSSTKPACAAAKKANKRVLFYYRAEWDSLTSLFDREVFTDPFGRGIVRRDYVALAIDRTETWMADNPSPAQKAIVDEAVERFRPWSSKMGSLMVYDSDCKERLADLSDERDADRIARRLEAL